MLRASKAREKSLEINSEDRKQLECIKEEINSAISMGDLYAFGNYHLRPNVERELIRLGYDVKDNNDSGFIIDWSYPRNN